MWHWLNKERGGEYFNGLKIDLLHIKFIADQDG
jgi:hypothetical protein